MLRANGLWHVPVAPAWSQWCCPSGWSAWCWAGCCPARGSTAGSCLDSAQAWRSSPHHCCSYAQYTALWGPVPSSQGWGHSSCLRSVTCSFTHVYSHPEHSWRRCCLCPPDTGRWSPSPLLGGGHHSGGGSSWGHMFPWDPTVLCVSGKAELNRNSRLALKKRQCNF